VQRHARPLLHGDATPCNAATEEWRISITRGIPRVATRTGLPSAPRSVRSGARVRSSSRMRFHADRSVEPHRGRGSSGAELVAPRVRGTQRRVGCSRATAQAGAAAHGRWTEHGIRQRLAAFGRSFGFFGEASASSAMQSCAIASSSTPSSTTRKAEEHGGAISFIFGEEDGRGVRRALSPRSTLMLASRRRRGRCSLAIRAGARAVVDDSTCAPVSSRTVSTPETNAPISAARFSSPSPKVRARVSMTTSPRASPSRLRNMPHVHAGRP